MWYSVDKSVLLILKNEKTYGAEKVGVVTPHPRHLGLFKASLMLSEIKSFQ